MKQLTPEEKVQITADMSMAITRVSLEGIKANNPKLSEEEMFQVLRERIKQRRK